VAGGDAIDQRVDLDPVPDDVGDQFAGQLGGHGIALRVRQMTFEDRLRGALSEVGLEDRGERESTPRRTPSAPVGRVATRASAPSLTISLRRHRR
jgi:hypothetical protein